MVKPIMPEHFKDYLKNKGLKRRTIKEYLYYMNKFSINHSNIINQETITLFISDPSHQNPSCRAFLRSYIEFLKQNKKFYEIVGETYTDLIEIQFPKVSGRRKERIPRYLTEEQIKRLEAVIEHERDKLALLLSYYTGLRLGELSKIGLRSFDWDKWKTTNYEDFLEVRVYGKGDKEGIALIPSFLGKRIANYINTKKWYEGKDKIFLYSQKLDNIDNQVRRWQLILRQAGVKAGISEKDEKGRVIEGTQIHPHLLRHSYGAYLIQKGVDIRKIKELLRHSDISSTQLYTHLDKSHLKEELKGLNMGENQQKTPENH